LSANSPPGLLDALFRTDAVREIFSDRGRLQGMLDFEAALARATARAGITPSPAAMQIESQCRADLFDAGALSRGTAAAGNPAIAMVKALTTLVESRNRDAARFVHWIPAWCFNCAVRSNSSRPDWGTCPMPWPGLQGSTSARRSRAAP